MKYHRILIAGASGFIAQNFFQYLTTLTEQPLIRLFDRRYGGDLCNWKDVERAWKRFGPDACVNFASHTHIDTSIKNPRMFTENNIGLMINILEACRKFDTRLLQISSSEVYGTNQNYPSTIPMTEEHPLCPHSPYAATKVAQDRFIYSWNNTYGLDASIVRPFNQYGPYQQLEKMIPKTMTRIMKGEAIPIYGEGKALRDWLFVQDTVRGIWMALQNLPPTEAVNLATGINYSVLELVEHIKATMSELGYEDRSKTVTVDHVDDRWGHVFCLLGSYEKAKKLLGWKPKHTLRQGLKKTALWLINSEWGLISRA